MKEQERFKKFGTELGKRIRADINKTVDDFCDEHNISDEKRKQFKKIVPIKIY